MEKRMTREELIAEFKEFMSKNRSDVEKHITPIKDISLDDDWFVDDGWDEIWKKRTEDEGGIKLAGSSYSISL